MALLRSGLASLPQGLKLRQEASNPIARVWQTISGWICEGSVTVDGKFQSSRDTASREAHLRNATDLSKVNDLLRMIKLSVCDPSSLPIPGQIHLCGLLCSKLESFTDFPPSNTAIARLSNHLQTLQSILQRDFPNYSSNLFLDTCTDLVSRSNFLLLHNTDVGPALFETALRFASQTEITAWKDGQPLDLEEQALERRRKALLRSCREAVSALLIGVMSRPGTECFVHVAGLELLKQMTAINSVAGVCRSAVLMLRTDDLRDRLAESNLGPGRVAGDQDPVETGLAKIQRQKVENEAWLKAWHVLCSAFILVGF